MSRWLFLTVILTASFTLGILDHALMVFQIRERLGFDPMIAMILGSATGWLKMMLIVVGYAVWQKSGKKRE